MADPRNIDPDRRDPLDPQIQSPYTDPAADPRVANQTVVQPGGGRGGLIAAGIIAVLLVIALIAFSTGPSTDPGTTAVIPEDGAATTETAPAPEAAPADDAAPAPEATAPLEEETAPAAPAEEEAPAANQ